MTEPNALLLSDESLPTISLAGVRWPIPKLALQQIEIVVPLILASRGVANLSTITTELLHNLGTILYWGLRRGHKDLTREEFDQMPIEFGDLLTGMTVVGQQSGVLKSPANGVAQVTAPGEAQGTSQTGAP